MPSHGCVCPSACVSLFVAMIVNVTVSGLFYMPLCLGIVFCVTMSGHSFMCHYVWA